MNVGKSKEKLSEVTNTTNQGALVRALTKTQVVFGGLTSGTYGDYSLLFSGLDRMDAGFRKGKWSMLVAH
jgi:hypothetical protein